MDYTPENFERLLRDIDKVLVNMEIKNKRIGELEDLLKLSYNYVRAHWERSRATTGGEAQRLMWRIQALVGVK